MFESKTAMFLYAISPVHMGSGTAIGAIDNPIQRERHTEHPMMAGSGIKGALRHHWAAAGDLDLVERIFGPYEEAAEHAGALSLADAQLVLFPVRSRRRSFVYTTCPTALARLKRLLGLAGITEADSWQIPRLGEDECVVLDEQLLHDGHLVLEAYRFQPTAEPGDAGAIAGWLAKHALPEGDGFEYFRTKLRTDLVVLSDSRLGFFVRHATVVEPHVRINDESGTADDGGLFYTENLPPESLLVSLVMCSVERYSKDKKPEQVLAASDVLKTFRDGDDGKSLPGFDGALVQVGGDATTGRGQVVLRVARPGQTEEVGDADS
jgi:CRISPR-associated protein Cmr4